jgi:hypothetical protein
MQSEAQISKTQKKRSNYSIQTAQQISKSGFATLECIQRLEKRDKQSKSGSKKPNKFFKKKLVDSLWRRLKTQEMRMQSSAHCSGIYRMRDRSKARQAGRQMSADARQRGEVGKLQSCEAARTGGRDGMCERT